MEYWSNGVLGKNHYSSTPIFQYSITPLLQSSLFAKMINNPKLMRFRQNGMIPKSIINLNP